MRWRRGTAGNVSLEVVEHGVDTWRLARYLDADADLERATAMMPQGRLPDRLSGHVVGVLPGQRMLWIEGHPSVEGLADPATLSSMETQLLDGLELLGLPRGRDAGVARADSTVTLRSTREVEVPGALAGVAALDVARMKPVVHGRPPQTVYFEGAFSSRKFARAYNKALEAGISTPGGLLRLEDQRRFIKESRRAVSDIEPGIDFASRFAAMARSADGVCAMSVPVLSRELAERVTIGEMTAREAERLAGHLVLEGAGVKGYPRSTLKRRRRELRDRGLVVADGFYEPIEIDLGEIFDAARAAWE
jgi:hypothetical protein